MKTHGYDFAFALTLDAVNAILAERLAESDMTITYQAPDVETGSDVTLDARLAPWQIDGGQNTLLRVRMPIERGRLTLSGDTLNGDYDLAGVTPIMEITLGWMGPGGDQSPTGSGDLTRLVFKPHPSQAEDNPGWVALWELLDPGRRLDNVASAVLCALMAAAVFDNRDKVAQVFASVDPRPAALASWLRPARWQYFVSEPDEGPAALCFLSQLDPATPLPARPAFDASALRSGDGVVLVSQSTVFQHALLPAVRATFPGSFHLEVDGEKASIRNDVPFDAGHVAANSYRHVATPAGDGLTVTASGSGPLKFLFGLADLPDASYSWSVQATNPAVYRDGKVAFASDPNPVVHHDETMPWYDWALLVIVGITSPPGLVAAVYDLVTGFGDEAQAGGTDRVNANLTAATGGAALNLADIVDWTAGGRRLVATAAGMSESLYVTLRLA